MARSLILSLDGHEFAVQLVKVTRDKLYGSVEIEAFDEHGHEAFLRVLAADGRTLIDKGGTALATLNEKGDSISRSSLIPVDFEGREIEPVPSSFGQPNVLYPATNDEYLTQMVKTVYAIEPEEDADRDFLIDHLSAKQIYKFQFSYRGGVEYDNAFILSRGGDAFMVVGTQGSVQFLKLNQASTLDSVEEQEITADELDFELL